MRNGVAPYLLLSYSVLCPHDRWGTLLLRNKEGPYTQLLYAVPWWQLRVLSSKWIKIIHPCPLLFHCVLVTTEDPVIMRNGDASCIKLLCAMPWWQLELCDPEEWRSFLSSSPLCCSVMRDECAVLLMSGGSNIPVLCYSVLCPDDCWGPFANERWRCSLSLAALFSCMMIA